MGMSDRAIAEQDRCKVCAGTGWTWWTENVPPPEKGKWVVCRECIGTGRTDHKGRKRQKPASPVSSG
jgi:DnaJ-class molecular chaperone